MHAHANTHAHGLTASPHVAFRHEGSEPVFFKDRDQVAVYEMNADRNEVISMSDPPVGSCC